jgi:hypothetical protein
MTLALLVGLALPGARASAEYEINFTDFLQLAGEEEPETGEVVNAIELNPAKAEDIKTIGEEELLKSTSEKDEQTVADRIEERCSNAEQCTCGSTCHSCGAPCSSCGSTCESCGAACGSLCCDAPSQRHVYAEAQLMALRAHVGESLVGKLRETYELSPRYVVGYENARGLGGRVRYWSYDRNTPELGRGGDHLLLDFDVVDIEGTTHFANKWMELILAGGFRWADVQMVANGLASRNDMPGGSVAVDFRGVICHDCKRNLHWSSVGGIRWSIFGGDWEGPSNGVIDPTRDDNIVVHELYGGAELRRHGKIDRYARLVFEVQNWRSDALAEETDISSIGFIGPRLDVGLSF